MNSILLISNNSKKISEYISNLKKLSPCLLFTYKSEEKEHSIETIKTINKEVSVYQPIKRMFLLEDFDLSSTEAQNSFLKLLEEHSENILFVLTTKYPYKILPTVRSRTKIVHIIDHERPDDILMTENSDQDIYKNSLALLSDPNFIANTKEKAIVITNSLIQHYRKLLLINIHAALILKEIMKIQSYIENNNLNPQLSIDHLLIFISKQYTIK